MFPPVANKKFAVTNPQGTDAASWSFQSNKVWLAMLYWKFVQRSSGEVIYTATGKSIITTQLERSDTNANQR